MTATTTGMPQVGDDVTFTAWCQDCGATLSRLRFVWDGEPREFGGHVCAGSERGVLVQMEWLHIDEDGAVSAPG